MKAKKEVDISATSSLMELNFIIKAHLTIGMIGHSSQRPIICICYVTELRSKS